MLSFVAVLLLGRFAYVTTYEPWIQFGGLNEAGYNAMMEFDTLDYKWIIHDTTLYINLCKGFSWFWKVLQQPRRLSLSLYRAPDDIEFFSTPFPPSSLLERKLWLRITSESGVGCK